MAAARSGDIEVAAVTTCGGNVDAEKTYAAAAKTMMATGCCFGDDCGDKWKCPPLARAVSSEQDLYYDGFSGSDGIGGLSDRFPDPKIPFLEAEVSESVIVDVLLSNPVDTVTIIALGPLTNIANAEKMHPGILKRAREVIAMAGAFEIPGNITPDAEFNVLQDPQSYQDVLDVVDITFFPLDVTMQFNLVQEDINRLTSFSDGKSRSDTSNNLLGFIADLWKFLTAQSLNFKQTKGNPHMTMHDSAAVGYLLYPGLFTLRRGRVHVDCEPDSYSFGRTSLDRRLKVSQRTNAFVCFGVDSASIRAAFVEDIQTLLEIIH
jgi:purine nucleosidase